ncbi:metal-dependent enzyme [Desmospora sp. 8437]|nr:metal-dependent enzyme [Desmospora sp. 8437]
METETVAYGGQAVVEGVMFGGRHAQVTAIRRKNGEIEMFEQTRGKRTGLNLLKKIPLIRGVIALVESSASGSRHLQFAADRYELEPGEEPEQTSSRLELILGVAVVGVLSLVIGKMIFTALPAFLASILFDGLVTNLILQNLIEGAIKTLLLLGYLLAISQTPLIKRLFQYHGAEHKVINAYESGEDLTVENVQKQSTLHYRCGSSFIILTVIVGVILYSFFSYDNVWDRIFTRLLLIPVVIGLSYELLRITNALRDVPVLTWLGYPGLWLQKLTTRQPEDDQVEVAIAAFNRMHQLDQEAAEPINGSSLVHSS